jgi:hypothetical protein
VVEMIRKTVQRKRLSDHGAGDLAYWLSRSPAERVEAVELLRRQRDGNAARLQRVARVLERRGKVVMERLVPLKAADRSFDLEFWSRVGSARKFEIAWQMVLESREWRGQPGGQPRLRKDVERLFSRKRPRRPGRMNKEHD